MAQAKAITANPTVKAVLEYLDTKSSSSVPTGAICFFATTAIPTGWLLCNGSQVSRTEYAALFAAIGTKFGEGDGSTTFTLPNLDDRFIEGTTDTAKVGQYLEAGLPNITGLTRSISCAQFSTNEGDEGAMYLQGGQQYRAEVNNSVIQPRVGIDASRSSSVYGASTTVQPNAILMLACIKI